ncbi:hypothetical protein CCMSSC00406_0007190 [Pleurotus cornucopiae]|uniref:Uncharacterized protein n=1 Tax=Pleurotus cornucopiae TaxID=5321 RepID=A0ACB7IVA3_PLECO|nr:hypothetical protein CCMSSC00406_0007190 [Pleurotus cornucopiae]
MRLSSESPTVVASDSSLIHRNTAAASSAPSTMHLTFPGVASMFVKMRRASSQAKVNAQGKPNHIESCSGLEPVTDLSLSGENATLSRKLPMTQTDVYTCIGGVNILVLLRATRSALMERAETLGANVLVDESWKCTICKNRSNGTYKVNIRYQARATRSSIPDPHKPVALDNAKGVPGLMTIIKRND